MPDLASFPMRKHPMLDLYLVAIPYLPIQGGSTLWEAFEFRTGLPCQFFTDRDKSAEVVLTQAINAINRAPIREVLEWLANLATKPTLNHAHDDGRQRSRSVTNQADGGGGA